MSRWATMVFAFFAALSSPGCATLGSIQRANTIGKGNWQGGIEPGVKGTSTDGQVHVGADMTASIRAGVSDRVDLGGRIGQSFYDIHMKYQFTETDSSGPIVSIAPSFSILGLPWDGGVILWGQVNLPVLIGVPVGQSQIIFGPRLMDSFFGGAIAGEGAVVHLLYAGSSFGFAARAGEKFSVLPELSLAYPVLADASPLLDESMDSWPNGNFLGTGLLLEFKLGFVIGAQ